MEIDIKGYKVLIDDEDVKRVLSLTWHIEKGMLRSSGRVYFAHHFPDPTLNARHKSHRIDLHRYLVGCKYKDGVIVDHINGNTLDNRKCNLRKCTIAENSRNAKMRKDNTIGYKGVQVSESGRRYRAHIKVSGKSIHLGYYNTPEEAHAAYCEASKKYHGEFGRTE